MSTATTEINLSEEEVETSVSDANDGGDDTTSGQQPTAIDPNAVRQKIVTAKTEDKSRLEERDVEVDLVWNSMLSKQHGVFVGTGGVAKSMTIDTAVDHIVGAAGGAKQARDVLFKVLLRKSMPVEEIFGPLSLKGLEQDQFRYITHGRAAEVNIVFLDEIFKANAVVLNAMLMLINERIFINDGVPHQVPLWVAFGASNELPNEPELHAFRDRFAWVKEVKPVQVDDAFKRVLRGGIARAVATVATTTLITTDEMHAAQAGVAAIDVPDDVLNDIATMKRRAEGEFDLYISARRYISGIRLCQAQAWLNGRTTVITDDLTLFQHTLWTDIEDAPKAYEVTLDYAGKVARVTQQLRGAFEPHHNDLAKLRSEIPTDGAISQEIAGKIASIQMNLKSVRTKVNQQIEDAKGDQRDSSELEALLSEIDADRSYIRDEILN